MSRNELPGWECRSLLPCRNALTTRWGYADPRYKETCLKSPTEWGGRRWVLVVWMGQESWTQMYNSGMNISSAMAPQSPGHSGTPPLSSLPPKKTTFQSLGSLSSGVFSPSPAKASTHQANPGSSRLNSPTPSIMSSPKLWQKASVSRLAEEFFWIGGSVVAQPKWRLGQIGNIKSTDH